MQLASGLSLATLRQQAEAMGDRQPAEQPESRLQTANQSGPSDRSTRLSGRLSDCGLPYVFAE